jgi:D-beta-D-heptose 7-phosphate kinase/D-beta-D-heptose 1-phosphate adenosyltransferase
MKVCVIGDVIVDRYIYGTADRLSPEAPIPVLKQTHIEDLLGGAGNLYQNLKSLNIDVDLLDFSNPRCVKTRVISNTTHIARVDDDHITDGAAVLAQIQAIDFSQYTYVILSDYAKGVLDEVHSIIEHVNKFGCKVIVDPKKMYAHYIGAWLVKPNGHEYYKYGFDKWSGNIIKTAAGENVVAEISETTYNVFVQKVDVSDVTGAGDCFLAAFVYGLTKQYDHKTCLELAVRGATKSVGYVGTYILKQEDLETVVFTNGCFDILHPGHVIYLQQAKAFGTKLVIGLNSDASIKRLKGNDRPIFNQSERLDALKRLGIADEIYIFEEDTPINLISSIKPDIIVKGGDYESGQVVGNELARVVIVPYIAGFSTTHILEKINAIVR